ncbi:hypothetical protein RO3G_09636 [Rhizopus delemar RA 99-880]|uniref:Cation efflux protein transmembrane domain-containing protein n=1 Tax=Rhizopus delemar (strain RA 99-880 / ATCC MYA-4621 / FGSC 9543 / NRRL 43880) TaxID=246409 RepID=I1C8Z6_RHIO9|nr:hypothetical protein RO3G_09636 [Rhizopus delemar RA 99-880]|eukprot:EIE84926.1 hypothetical protein RO3G_09636 [Rhizopus delemar RA 99-880]
MLTIQKVAQLSTRSTFVKASFYKNQRLFVTKALVTVPRYPIFKSPISLGNIRHHGTHGHHHHDTDILTSLKSSSKRGTRITIIGLASNVGLTVSKGVAGWMMNSASLLAESLHSFSGKFETVGSVAVSSLLLAGAIGIGWHSLDLLIATLNTVTTSATLPDTTMAVVAASSTAVETSSHSFFSHSHAHGGVLDPNAAWFALASVIIKEWLFRATIKVGQAERSDVLMANAWHHRSDAYSSAVALVAIVGSYAGMPVLDPLGGIAVSAMLASESGLVNFHSIRGRKQGRYNHIDLVLQLNPDMSMQKAYKLEQLVKDTVKNDCENIQDVLVYLEDTSAIKKQVDNSHDFVDHHHHHEHHH